MALSVRVSSFLRLAGRGRRPVLLLALVLAALGSRAQASAWEHALLLAQPTGHSIIKHTALTADGDVVVAGIYSGTLPLGATTLTAASDVDAFVAKWNTRSNRWPLPTATTDLPLVGLPAGIYSLCLPHSGGRSTRRLVIE